MSLSVRADVRGSCMMQIMGVLATLRFSGLPQQNAMSGFLFHWCICAFAQSMQRTDVSLGFCFAIFGFMNFYVGYAFFKLLLDFLCFVIGSILCVATSAVIVKDCIEE